MMTLLRLKEKVAVVTGGDSGIGRASSVLFAREGAMVVVSDIVDGSGEEVRAIEQDGRKAIYVHCDVTKEDKTKNPKSAASSTKPAAGVAKIVATTPATTDGSPIRTTARRIVRMAAINP